MELRGVIYINMKKSYICGGGGITDGVTMHNSCTLLTVQLFNLEFQFESVFNLEFHSKFGIQPIPMGISLGECGVTTHTY